MTLWGLNPNRDWKSRLASLNHNICLVVETAFIAGVITAAWAWCFSKKWPFHIHTDVDLVMLSTSILVCAAIFAFVAATLFAQVRTRNIAMARAILLGDKLEFMLQRDEKIQIMMHVVVAFFGLATLMLFAVAGYTNLWVGATIIFLTSACIVVYFISMFEMQNVSNSIWFRTHTPKEWFSQKSSEFFAQHRQERRQKTLA